MTFASGFYFRGCYFFFFFFVPNGSCLILKWNSSVTSIHYFMFMHVECFILLNANPLFDLNGWPFETF